MVDSRKRLTKAKLRISKSIFAETFVNLDDYYLRLKLDTNSLIHPVDTRSWKTTKAYIRDVVFDGTTRQNNVLSTR